MAELPSLSLAELRSAFTSRKASPVDLAEAVLARIAATQPTLNAFTALRGRDAILADARAAEARLARGEGRPLEGIALGVKDLEAVAGLPHVHGSAIYRDRVASYTEVHVQRLQDAGAIVVGKTNTPEFGYTAITRNLVYGVTRSPWDLERTPGGSSGGSAAALAGSVCPLVTASDGGGSIRIPGSFTGCFGLKPSQGRVPRGPLPHWDYQATAVYGPLTRTVADAALLLDVMAGPSPWDPQSLPPAGLSYASTLAEPLPPLRFGFSPDLGYAAVQSDVAAAVEDAAQVFAKLGHRLEAAPGGPPALGREWGLLGAFELAAELHDAIPGNEDKFGRGFLAGAKTGWQMTPERWRAIGDQRVALNRWCAETFERFDLLVTPTVPYDPPPATGPFPDEVEGRAQPYASVASFTIPFNLSWHPAATLRAGLSRRGLPIGLQIVGPRHRDDLVLRAAAAFERERPWHPEWPAV